MVLGLTQLRNLVSGLAQGGGFGIGYGFGVRLGYDAYGGLKDLITKGSQGARYSTSPFTSHLGSGILSALGLGDAQDIASATNRSAPQPTTLGLNTVEKQEGIYSKQARRASEGYMDFASSDASFMNYF
jgi:hypothetical protein